MPTPTLDGFEVFGEAVAMATTQANEVQVNAYPLVDGLQTVDLGSRGATTAVEGWLVGGTAEERAAAASILRTLMFDRTPRTLVDTDGVTWPKVRVLEFAPTPGGRLADASGYYQAYTATLLHLA